jgi:hypothetical protein
MIRTTPKDRQEVEVPDSELVQIAKRNGEFLKWGKLLGAYLYLKSLNAARPRSVWWWRLVSLAILAIGATLKLGWPLALFG